MIFIFICCTRLLHPSSVHVGCDIDKVARGKDFFFFGVLPCWVVNTMSPILHTHLLVLSIADTT
jgi:hypothetical protein